MGGNSILKKERFEFTNNLGTDDRHGKHYGNIYRGKILRVK